MEVKQGNSEYQEQAVKISGVRNQEGVLGYSQEILRAKGTEKSNA